MLKKIILNIFFVFVLVAWGFAQNNSIKKIRLEDYLDMERVSDPQISHDGKEIIYSRRWIDKIEDRSQTDIWIINSDGSQNRFFLRGGNPKWSPDGTRIAYVSQGEPKGSQIFVKYRNIEGPPTQVTRLEESPSNITWSPDGKFIAFTMLVPDKESWPIKLPGKPEDAKWTKSPRIVEDVVYRRDRIGFMEEGYSQIFMVTSTGGTAKQITDGKWNQGRGGISWTRDGKEILFSSLRIPDAEYAWRESEIYAINVDTKEIRQLTLRKGPDNNPIVSPDNKLVVYRGYDWTDDAYINSKIYVMNLDGSNQKMISGDLDRGFSNIIWAEDNSGVYFNVNNQGNRNYYFASVKGGIKAITKGNHMLSVSTMSKNSTAVGVLSDYYNQGDIVSFNVKNPTIIQLTYVNDDVLGDVTLGEVEDIWYKSVDNFNIQGWIIKPPDFEPNKKYPLILTIHGGPHAMYSVGFNFRWQMHAADGYIILYINPRGSTGYGGDFANAIKNAYPGNDYDDLMKGVDEVIKKKYIDEQNLFVYGGSGGGVLTSWIVGHTDRFAAASVNYPVINWISFVGTTDGVSWYRNFKKFPWEDPSEHLKRSSLMYVGNVKTPTMLMTGVKDLRTPISQTEEFYQALKILKVPTAMIRFNEEFHGTSSKPSNYLRTILFMNYWFQKHGRNTTLNPK